MLDKIGINPIYLAGQIVNFLILFFVLKTFVYKPVLKLLDKRTKRISQGLKAAEENIKNKEKFEEQKKAELGKVRKEVEKILAEAKKESQKQGVLIIENARAEAKKQGEKEFQQFQQRLAEEEKALKGKVTKIALDLSKKILKDSLDSSTQKEVFASQVENLKKLK